MKFGVIFASNLAVALTANLSAAPQAPHPTPWPQLDKPCLCLFDIDRTLTGAQKANSIGKCKNNKWFSHVWDPAYGGGTLALSEGFLNMEKTFCSQCYVGIISKGTAGGEDSQMRSVIVEYLNFQGRRKQNTQVPNKWSQFNRSDRATGGVHSMLVWGVDDDAKHWIAFQLMNAMARMKPPINIEHENAYFFDDRADNVGTFSNHLEQARQISCKSRDNNIKYQNAIGYCGMTSDEIVAVKDKDVVTCPKTETMLV